MTSKELLHKTKVALHAKYITNSMVAEKLGVSRQAVNRKLNADDCSLDEFARIAGVAEIIACGELFMPKFLFCIDKISRNVKLSKFLEGLTDYEADKLFKSNNYE